MVIETLKVEEYMTIIQGVGETPETRYKSIVECQRSHCWLLYCQIVSAWLRLRADVKNSLHHVTY